MPASFRQIAAAFCCLLHWGYLLLELDVTAFREIAAAFCCLLPCSALGPRSHFGSRCRSGLGFAAGLFSANCCCGYLLLELDVTVAISAQGTDQLPASFRQIACSALGRPLAGARCHRSHFGSRYRSGLGFAAGLFSANCCCFLLSSSLQRTGATSCWS